MNFENAVGFVHSILRSTLQGGDVAVDATIGNGWDTALMAELVGENGVVYGFDIQPVALEVTRVRTENASADVKLFLHGHENMDAHIASEHRGRVKAVTFNLGYLPGGDKDITTQAESTISGLEQARDLLAPRGIITVVCYRHAEGEKELNVVRDLLSTWPQKNYTAVESAFINQHSLPPVVFTVQTH